MAARRTVGRPLCDDVIADGALHGFALNLRGLYPRWPVHHTFFQRGSGRDSPGGGWGAGAKPRMRDFREFQYKIEKVPRSMKSNYVKSMDPGASRRVHASPYSIPKFLICVKVYILV